MIANLSNLLKQTVKRCYDWLPLVFERKLRIKVKLFETFPAMFRHTNAYRRWQAFQQAPVAETVLEIPSEAFTSTFERIYQDQIQASLSAEKGPDYVALETQSTAFETPVKLLAFYLPQFHPIPENDEWWGKGFTEWTNVGKAVPQFAGHYQPRLPGELGYYDLRLPEVMKRQVELAKLYGIFGFCFHYYWFGGRRLLEKPLNDFLASDIDFPYCVCWANENWTRRWDGHDQDVLIGQKHSSENDLEFIHDVVPILQDRRAIKIDGKPLLIVYRPSLLPDPKATLERWRKYCRDSGVGEIFLAMVQFDVLDPIALGFDAALEFPPHKLAAGLPGIHGQMQFGNPAYAGYVLEYKDIVQRAKELATPAYPMFRGVFPGWDNEARKPGRGYTFANSTPAKYRQWLENSIEFARHNPVAGEQVVFINAWNEWAEGAYLEPDRKFGYAYLQATRDALTGDSQAGKKHKVLVVGHDAHPHGAQYLALNIARELVAMGIEIEIVLLGEGVLLPDYQAIGIVHRVDANNSAARSELASALSGRGFKHAIANTVVSGLFLAELARAKMDVVSLVHELPGVIESFGLQSQAKAISQSAKRIVFANEYIGTEFAKLQPLAAGKTVIRKQGLYKRNRFRSDASVQSSRDWLRGSLNIAKEARIILGVGYADHRKGIDLFVEIAERTMQKHPDAHFVWIGHFDTRIEKEIRAFAAGSKFADRYHFPGRQTDTDRFYAGADILALTSREDPFPSVIMEAFDVGIPVIAFSGAGGFEAFLKKSGAILVGNFDVNEFADAVENHLQDEQLRLRIGMAGKQAVEAEFSFREYVFDLLKLVGIDIPRVSVVVPNFNYAHLLADRIDSINRQTLPVYEVIILDDASTDDSVELISSLKKKHDLKVIVNRVNSGSVFRQWLKGVELARGDFVWIAEADDLSDPEFLETVMKPFTDPKLAMSYTESMQMDEHGKVIAGNYREYLADLEPARWDTSYVRSGNEEIVEVMSVKNSVPNVSAALFRREQLHSVLQRYSEEVSSFHFAGDWALYVRLLEQGKIAFNCKPLNRHRRHSASVTSGTDKQKHLHEVIRMQQVVAQRHAVPPAIQDKASRYIGELERYFGLPPASLRKSGPGV